jgi:hypothetical protein
MPRSSKRSLSSSFPIIIFIMGATAFPIVSTYVCTYYWVTNSMEYSPSLETKVSQLVKKFPVFMDPKVHYWYHKSPPLVSVVSQINPGSRHLPGGTRQNHENRGNRPGFQRGTYEYKSVSVYTGQTLFNIRLVLDDRGKAVWYEHSNWYEGNVWSRVESYCLSFGNSLLNR